MIKTIAALERDGLDVRVLVLNFEVPAADFPLRNAVKAAATEFCQTEKGRSVYEYNCSCFNWADFAMNVPGWLCEKHGFKLIASETDDEVVDWDEQLVDESSVVEEDALFEVYIEHADGHTWRTGAESLEDAQHIVENEAVSVRENCADEDIADIFPLYWSIKGECDGNEILCTGHVDETGMMYSG